MPIAIKSIKQPLVPTSPLPELMETFRHMVNDCIKIGLQHDAYSRKTLSNLAYKRLANYDIISYYKLGAISHAAGILANRRKSIRRGLRPRQPYAKRPLLISCYGIKIVSEGLKIPLGGRQSYDIPLNPHVRGVLSNPQFKIHSFTLTPDCVSVCYSKWVEAIDCTNVSGVDRNLGNLTVGDGYRVVQYDLCKAVDIAENTRSIIRSFRRSDVRIRRKHYRKYGLRRRCRLNQLLHRLTKTIVQIAKQNRTSLAFEDIRHIRGLYRKGNYQGRAFRSRMNSWSFAEVKRQVEYKAKWEGIPVVQQSKSETRDTSQLCPQCGKKITQVDRKTRELWCAECRRWMDRDIVGAMNISIKGLARFASSQGLAGEAMKGKPTTPVILRVDASKLAFRRRQSTS